MLPIRAQCRKYAGSEPLQNREIWDDLCHRRQGQQIENDYDKEVYNGDIAIDLDLSLAS